MIVKELVKKFIKTTILGVLITKISLWFRNKIIQKQQLRDMEQRERQREINMRRAHDEYGKLEKYLKDRI